MTRQSGRRQQVSKRLMTRRLAAGGAAAMVAALAIPSLTAAGGAAAASVSRAGGRTARETAAASGGTLRAWGANGLGQLGDGTTSNSDVPVKVKLPPGTRITSARVGCDHALALTSSGEVLAWGNNNTGQLGDGTTGSSSVPVKVLLPPGTKVTAIRAGCADSLALTSDGQVLAWGFNGDGQLGTGTPGGSSATPVPVLLPAGTTVTAITAGTAHNLALTSKGKVLAWGFNADMELGDGTVGSLSATPGQVLLPPGVKVTAVAAGDSHSLARTSNGKVLAWGDNRNGELGTGKSGGNSATPVRARLARGTRVRGLFGGCAYTMVLTSKHKVLAWGANGHGELGDGTFRQRGTPVRPRLPKGIKVTAISAACEYGLARTSKGKVLAWGFNGSGELGDGSTTDSPLPVRVKLPAGLAAVSLGAGPAADSTLAVVRKAKP